MNSVRNKQKMTNKIAFVL